MYDVSYTNVIKALEEFHDTMPGLKISEVSAGVMCVNIKAADGYTYQFDLLSDALWRLGNWRTGEKTLVNGK